MAPSYRPAMPLVASTVGTGVVWAIHACHLIKLRTVRVVAFALDGSLNEQDGGPYEYSSASNPKLWPDSCKTSSIAAELVDATAMLPPDPPYSKSFTSTSTMSRAFGED